MTASTNFSFAPAGRGWRAVALAVTLAGALAVIGTHFSFSNTLDEPAHIGAGMEWLGGTHRYDAQYPPLPAIAAAMGPFLSGERGLSASSAADEGSRVLGRGAHYQLTLAYARVGALPFFLLLCGVVWLWGRRLTDERGAAMAVVLVTTNPNVLAWAGLATSDIAIAATISAALLAFIVWLDAPRWPSALALGAGVALVAATDYAAFAVLLVAFAGVYGMRRRANGGPLWAAESPGLSWLALSVTCATIVLLTWAMYGFRFGALGELSIPGADWFRGLASFVTERAPNHPAYLFGERSMSGWWYYYAVALLVKTPLPIFLLAIIGAAAAGRGFVRYDSWQRAAPLVASLGIVLAVSIVGDDTGVRLALPVYALMALLGAVAAVELWDHAASSVPARRLVRATVVSIIGAAVLVPMRTHPDYLAYFNALAGERPELILVDSNLDWGQDLYRLGTVMRRMHIDSIAVAYYGSATLDAAGVRNARPLAAAERPRGWIAASQTMLAGVGGDGAYEWLNELHPVGRVGASLVLYYVPPPKRR
ncbi:MAG TPA: hypothetical protein VJN70_12365 [Gemmatimonadaceae bacterium]|nr:hypothetical protein [Gemmatimonadaceae bacterium]